jgi:hypothetical protein
LLARLSLFRRSGAEKENYGADIGKFPEGGEKSDGAASAGVCDAAPRHIKYNNPAQGGAPDYLPTE